MQVLVRVAPEINLKSPKVKAKFLKILKQNMKVALDAAEIEHHIEDNWSRFYVELASEEGISVLSRVFGIASISPIEHRCEPTLEEMATTIVKHYQEKVSGKSFCVRVKRSTVKGFTSIEAERYLGGNLGKFAREVNLTEPEVKIEVDANPRGAHFFSERVEGPHGLPLGSQGRALCLISGGFDSAVAAWRMMKRGVALDYVFCNLAGQAYEKSVCAVVKGLHQQWGFGTNPNIYVLDFQGISRAINENVKASFAQVVLKRCFYRACGKVARYIKATGLVTGEAVGQVSSQTLLNLAAIDQISETLIMRPLISFDKDEILKTAREIGTYLLCEHIQEYCAINPKKPVTGAKPESVTAQEDRLPENLIDDCLKGIKKLVVKDLDDQELMAKSHFIEEILAGDVVVDSRERGEFDEWHYPGSLHLPLKTLALAYSKFDKTQKYILICPFGLQTAVIAEQMQKLGYEAYSFLGGAHKLKKKYSNPS